ncbi:jg3093 [Pararge aegeria aegeria]|uniref:Jg3093 protein n=1 Tax=Pararge aegeria aegeria TaxID=348720 RepID=A0A8S4QL79_9NEOP|nr:jg3093 [Pararge aegeria aegeria]
MSNPDHTLSESNPISNGKQTQLNSNRTRPNHPGAVVEVSDNPLDASKLVIAFETGLVGGVGPARARGRVARLPGHGRRGRRGARGRVAAGRQAHDGARRRRAGHVEPARAAPHGAVLPSRCVLTGLKNLGGLSKFKILNFDEIPYKPVLKIQIG